MIDNNFNKRRPLPSIPQRNAPTEDSGSLSGRASPPPAYQETIEPSLMQQVATAASRQTQSTPKPPIQTGLNAPQTSAQSSFDLGVTSSQTQGPASQHALPTNDWSGESLLIGDTRHHHQRKKKIIIAGIAVGALALAGIAAGVGLALSHKKAGHPDASQAPGTTLGTLTGLSTPAPSQTTSQNTGSATTPTPTAASSTTQTPASTTSTSTSTSASASPTAALWTPGNYQVRYTPLSSSCDAFGIQCNLDDQVWAVGFDGSQYSLSNNANAQGPWMASPKQGGTALSFSESVNDYTTTDGCIFQQAQIWKIALPSGPGALPSSASMKDIFTGYDITCIRPDGTILAPKSSCSCSYDVGVSVYR